MSPADPRIATERLLRDLAPQALGAVIRRFGDFSASEDAVQEALLAAATQWPAQGVPDNPRGWLIQVAARRMTDHLRSEIARRRRETESFEQTPPEELLAPAADETLENAGDDALRLLFLCCHSALTPASAIALTLRAVGGLTTAEIANAFLVPEATMAQRISRAKQSVQEAGGRFHTPDPAEQAERLPSVLHVLYLIFNEGYASSVGTELQRGDLADEAIRLARILHQLLPENTEAAGLLALMLLTDARRAARTGPGGEPIPLDRQDRSLWDRLAIAEGTALLGIVLPRGAVGPYQLQAAIAAVHDEADRAEDTDWPRILALYELLKRMSDNPMVALNHAVAAAMVRGPRAGLDLLEALDKDKRMANNHRLDAVRAHLLEMAGDKAAAIARYRAAAMRTTSVPERDYLGAQASRLETSIDRPA
ncbi:sigma-70 family RNA polymerase sigma factor [Luteimonas gilva]|uniref:Sigma-70 family RNA polymerase sigma factor n=1 Tax=Luteimonas gilva TaxID=2572684 RepID=A0A4U5JUK3_9GAMM|nr:sigma-70 family RNA polymerase sigma factor [Luteimonas gilva]TKR33552.1 sigma-70 family RNA polymerase sigma factor [Luteimonas gilva]